MSKKLVCSQTAIAADSTAQEVSLPATAQSKASMVERAEIVLHEAAEMEWQESPMKIDHRYE